MSDVPQRSIQSILRSGETIERFANYVGQEEAGHVVASVMGVVNNNKVLQQCSNESVLSAALTGVSLGLNVNPALGQAYIVPYRNKKKIKDENGKEREEWVWEAQFQIGFKGFLQLALRTREYTRLNVTEIREGEYKGENIITGDYEFEPVKDKAEREKLPVVGYVAYLRLTSGFEKMLYMTKEEVDKHAKRYSQAYKNGYGLWKTDFDMMAMKTVLKLLISKYGPTSSKKLQTAFLADQAVVEEDSFSYIDNGNKSSGKVEATPEGEVVENETTNTDETK